MQLYNLGTLSEKGWINNGKDVFDKTFSYFLASDYSQSNIFHGKITSFPYLLHKAGNDIDGLLVSTKNALEIYMGRYFDDVGVLVEDVTKDDSGNSTISIYFNIKYRGEELDVTSIVNYTTGSTSGISHFNSFG